VIYLPKGRRKYLPHSLTFEEKLSPKLRKKLSSCVRKVERKSCPKKARKRDGSFDYSKCMVNPVAVCRASLKRTKKRKSRVV
jgi:hypothetical protein